VILRLAVLMQYRRVTYTHADTQTDTQTHDGGYYPRRVSSARAKIAASRQRLHGQIATKMECWQIALLPVSF